MKKIIATALLCTMIFTPAMAIEGIKSPSGILMDKNGTVIWEKEADTPLEPASVTKVMTMLLVAEAVDSGKISREDVVTTSAHAANMGGSQIYLKEGEQMTVNEMLKAVAVASANDAAVALAEHLAGTEESFVSNMNKRAQELGMINTNFVNTNGLPASGHLSSARDIATMSKELLKHEFMLDYTKIWIDSLRGGEFQLVNTNSMIKSYLGMTGLKTGFTTSAGYCLSATASRDGLDLIAVVLKGESSKLRNADVTSMLNYGFANYAAFDVSKKILLKPLAVVLGVEENVQLSLQNSAPFLIEKSKIEQVVYDMNLPENIEAPIAKGDVIGTVTVRTGDQNIGTIEIIAQQDVAKLKLSQLFYKILSLACGRK